MNKVKIGHKEYFKPTPKVMRQTGDVLLFVAAIGLVLVPGAKWVAVAGIAGKFLTNFFSNK